MSEVTVLTRQELTEIIQDTWNQAKEATEALLEERWMSIPKVALYLNESETHIHRRIAANQFKTIRFKGKHKEVKFSEVKRLLTLNTK